jgi:hypothetical protein
MYINSNVTPHQNCRLFLTRMYGTIAVSKRMIEFNFYSKAFRESCVWLMILSGVMILNSVVLVYCSTLAHYEQSENAEFSPSLIAVRRVKTLATIDMFRQINVHAIPSVRTDIDYENQSFVCSLLA